MMRWAASAIFAALVLAAACDDNDGSPDNGDNGRGNGGIPVTRVTGNEALDYTISAALARDVFELAAITLYHQVECTDEVNELPAPECRPDEDEGDEVEVFRLVDCDGGIWIRPEELPGTLQGLIARDTLDLVSVYQPTDDVPEDPDFVAVFRTTPESEPQGEGIALYVKESRAYAIECGADITRLLTDDRIEDEIFSQ
jgi:hypothetical protein